MEDQIKDICQRIRALREIAGLSVEEFASYCDIDPEQARAADTGNHDISIMLLQKIARKFDITLDELMFGHEPRMTTYFLTRSGKGPAVERRAAYKYQSLAAGFRDRVAEPFLVTVEPTDNPISQTSHHGQEFIMVFEGTLLVRIGETDLTLNVGDSLYFSAHQKHGMKALNGTNAQFLSIII